MAAPITFALTPQSQDAVIQFMGQSCNMLNQQWNIREEMRHVDLQYMRELDLTKANQRAKTANAYGDADKFQNLTIPVVLPAVESAVVYQSSVFLTGIPLFDVVASPRYEDAAIQLSAVIDENATRGGWARHFDLFFRDGFKYNFSALEVVWDRKTTWSPVGNNESAELSKIIWQGNCVNRWDPYNTFWDSRVPVTEVPTRGEFAGKVDLMSRIDLKQFIANLQGVITQNVKAAFESGYTGGPLANSAIGRYYIPPLNARINTVQPFLGTDWMAWAQASGTLESQRVKIDYKNIFEVTTLYARILPLDFNIRVPAASTPQIWKFIIVNAQVVLFAERQTNAHEKIPVLFGSPLEDGLSYQTKSLATNVAPIQEVASAMMNSVIAARRRAISDRGLYDPSRVSEAAINSANPSAKIPVKPAAYGKPLGESYYPIPFEDRNSPQIMSELGPIIKLADVISGQNPARQGQFVKGNKTREEYSDVMGHSNGRDQLTALLYEAQIFTPLKEMLKLNVLQYQGAKSVFYRKEEKIIDIDPVALRNAVLEFKVSDGLTPTAKIISADTLQIALQVMGSSPQISSQYNVGALFSYLMKTQSAQISEFEKSKEQVAYESAMGQWSQLAQLAIENKQPFNSPQPLPEQFGYLVNGQIQQNNTPPPNALQTLIGQISQSASSQQAA